MRDTTALFGFGVRDTGAYLYLSIDDERIEGKVTDKLGAVKSVAAYGNGFFIFACDMRDEEYADFCELAEINGCLDKWEALFTRIKEVKIVNE